MSAEPPRELPAVITSISVQKKNRDRYSLYVEDGFFMGVSESTLLEFKLAKGVEVTPALYRKIQRAEGRFAVKSYLMKLLARRDHARRELMNKALKKDYPREVVQRVLDELAEKGYIDELGFARKYVADKYELNRWGPSKIKAQLFKKGIPEHIIQPALNETFGEIDFKDTFLNLVLKRKRRFLKEEDLYKRKKKVFDYLQRKGFKPDDIFKHIDSLLEAIADE